MDKFVSKQSQISSKLQQAVEDIESGIMFSLSVGAIIPVKNYGLLSVCLGLPVNPNVPHFCNVASITSRVFIHWMEGEVLITCNSVY